jgi:hypothetical protein
MVAAVPRRREDRDLPIVPWNHLALFEIAFDPRESLGMHEVREQSERAVPQARFLSRGQLGERGLPELPHAVDG